MITQDDFTDDDMLGAVCLNGNWQLFAGGTAEWILDYTKYDPAAVVEPDFQHFRGGIAMLTRPQQKNLYEQWSLMS